MPRIVVQNWPKLWFTVAAVPLFRFAGDRAPCWAGFHEGSRSSPAWHLSGVRAGALSLVIPVTGAMMMWLRSHRSRKSGDYASGDAAMVAAQ